MAKKQLAATPRLKAGTYTALAVLRYVRRLIKQEPKRLDMGWWESAYRGAIRTDPWGDEMAAKDALPACGTVACAAGWINIATGNERSNQRGRRVDDPGRRAIRNLGLDDNSDAAQALQSLFESVMDGDEQVTESLSVIAAQHRAELQRSRVTVKPTRASARNAAK